MFEYEGGALWMLPLVIIATPFAIAAIFCGAIVAVLTGYFCFKWQAW